MPSIQELIQKASDMQFKEKRLEDACVVYQYILNEFPDSGQKSMIEQMMNSLKSSGVEFDKIQSENLLPEIQPYYADIVERKEQAAKSLASYTQNKKDMILTTCPGVDGYYASKQLGIVYGEVVYKIGFLKSISAAVSNINDTYFTFGDKELSGSMQLIETAREYATNKMINDAASRGANAIIGIDSESTMGGDVMHMTIYGTAVFLEKNTL